MILKKILVVGSLAMIAALLYTFLFDNAFEEKVDYSTEVKPLLNSKCISCHGGVKRTGGFSLLFREEAVADTESGHPAIIPGDAANSEFIKRLTHPDPEERMPPESPPLSDEEIDLLTRWVDQGAEWGQHWAYKKIEKVEVPHAEPATASMHATDRTYNVENEIDRFIIDKLNQKNLAPSKEAAPEVLARRLSLDLIGMPASQELLNQYLNNPSNKTYEALVDNLMASPKFGEKWASMWLDLARYADSKGYEKDSERTIWKYRDWVIDAFNQDKPFDAFTIEQLAGDLLPNPTDEQLVATGFHRNTMNNDEGGTDDEEFRVAAVLDRVNTTMDTWMGTTFACVQCHSHPYDPFKIEEYYKFYAFFNNTRDEDVPGEYPNIRFYEKEEDKAQIDKIARWVKEHTGSEKAADETHLFFKTFEPKYQPHDFDSIVTGALIDNKFLGVEHGGLARLPHVNLAKADKLLLRYGAAKSQGKMEIRLDSPEGEKIGEIKVKASGGFWKHRAEQIDITPVEGVHDVYFIYQSPGNKGYVSSLEWLLFRKSLPGKEENLQQQLEASIPKLVDAPVKRSPILMENPQDFRRETYVFERGNWTAHGEKVQPGVPAFLHDLEIREGNKEADRLDLAKWIVSPDNPLTARVMVNRIWENIFGIGILETSEDFGTQGASPSHPELLEWLAYNFIHDYEWSMKQLIKTMVMSATYRQDSKVSNEVLAVDPANRYLARGPRFRLSGEQVRDQALAVSGLLSEKMYGKGVMPPQPQGVWQVVYSGLAWQTSEGEDRYRRALYTFWRRTSPYPSLISFDAPSREFCVPRRIRTNTPLQSLVTLNDPVYIETAISLAKQMLATNDLGTGIKDGYKKAVLKDISENKQAALETLWKESYAHFQENEEAVYALLKFPNAYDELETEKKKEEDEMEGEVNLETGTDKDLFKGDPLCDGNCEELAAMTIVANAIMNMDEFLTKE